MQISLFGFATLIIFVAILLFNYFKEIWKDPTWSAWYFDVVILIIFLSLVIGIVI